jgi:hypothetical protein
MADPSAAAAPAPLASQLAGAAAEVAAFAVGASAQTLQALDNSVELHLTRIDEAGALVEDVRAEVQRATDTTFPALAQNAQELAALFAVLDRADEAAARAHAAARAAAERLEQLQAGYDQKFPEGMAKLSAMFSFGAKARATQDAPVRLPPFDPASARIDAAAEIAALRAAVGVSNVAVLAADVAAGPEEGAADAGAEGDDAAEGEGGAEVAALEAPQ